MSWISRLFFGPGGGAAPLAAASAAPIGTGILSPWADRSNLAHIAYSELLGTSTDIVDRNAAMTVAPIKRGRAIIVSSIADLTLMAGRFTPEVFAPMPTQPAWLTRTRTIETIWHRMAWTIDDLIFGGWSLWALERNTSGAVTDAVRVHPSRWAFDANTPLGIRIDDRPLTNAASVCLFRGPDEGLLATAADLVRGARAIEAAWVGRVRNPIPLQVLHEVETNGVEEDEAVELVNTYAGARRSVDGAVAWLPAGVNLEVHGEVVADLFTEGRNNVRLDVANHLNLPASMLDGSTATASLTYQTAQGEFSQLQSWLEYWLAPIEARLSMDDMTPRGQVIRFDRGDLTANSDHGPELVPSDDDTKEITA